MSRTLVLWCPDWPVVTALREAGRRTSLPAAVFTANRVQACTAAARTDGVTVGQRRREAQSRCPELVVLKADPERDAREFERVAVAAEALAPGWRYSGRGCSPARSAGRPGTSAARPRQPRCWWTPSRHSAWNAESAWPTRWRSPCSPPGGPRWCPVGGSTEFCAPLPIGSARRRALHRRRRATGAGRPAGPARPHHARRLRVAAGDQGRHPVRRRRCARPPAGPWARGARGVPPAHPTRSHHSPAV